MKKIVFLFLSLILLACNSDDEKVSLTKDAVVGTWDVTEYSENGGSFNAIAEGYIRVTLLSDNNYTVKFLSNTYIGTYKIDGNTVIGTTLDPITEYFTFDKLDGSNAEISYKNSTGDVYKFKAKKK